MTTSAFTYAASVVAADTMRGKLAPPEDVDYDAPAPEGLVAPTAPGRPPELPIVAGRAGRVPPIAGMKDRQQRGRILHALANHELQAIELFAWAVLAFPTTPATFRRGLLAIVADEQRHLALYVERMAALGVRFGEHPVTGHFWGKLDHLATPLEFVCAMGLTFENANLDFAVEYARAADACGDHATADVLRRVHEDEIAHVHFGWTWMRKLAPDGDPWQTYLASTRYPLGPARARGRDFDREARRRAGLSEAFIDELAAIAPKQPSGAPR